VRHFRTGTGVTLLSAWLLAALLVPGSVHAKKPVAKTGARPAIILVLDVPASMNDTPFGLPVDCAQGQKSRWVEVRGALGGEWGDDYSCTLETESVFDPTNRPLRCPRDVEHPKPGESERTDGFIQSHYDEVRFGLLTTDFLTNHSDDDCGAYSWGVDNLTGVFPDGHEEKINLGARGEDAHGKAVGAGGALPGALMFIGSPGIGANVRKHNEEVLEELDKVLPYGRTSLAALLRDVHEYLGEPKLKRDGTGPPGNRCRDWRVVLITDGQSDPDWDDQAHPDGERPGNPYGSATDWARAISADMDDPVPVEVILVAAGADDDLRARMHALAMAGDTGVARVVSNAGDLREELDDLLNVMLAGTKSESRPTLTTQTHNRDMSHMIVGGAYTVPGEEGAWWGHFERLDYLCEDTERPDTMYSYGGTRKDDEDDEGEEGALLEQIESGERNIWTSVDGEAVLFDSSSVTPEHLGVGSDAERDDLIDFVKGETTDRYGEVKRPLGAIIHSDPAIVGPPLYTLPFPAYESGFTDAGGNSRKPYKRRHKDRNTVAYVGANDGMLHAFTLATPDGPGKEEAWGFIPEAFLGRLKELPGATGLVHFVDGSPVTRLLRRERAPNTRLEDEVWQDVLVGGVGRGGRLWYALDVSDATQPVLIWELPAEIDEKAHEARDYDDLLGNASEFYKYLGESRGRAAFGSVVLVNVAGDREEQAVVFLPGGWPTDKPKDQGRAFYVVSLVPRGERLPGKPKILRSFHPGLRNAPEELRFPITGSPTSYLDWPGQQTTRVFVGDQGGQLWRIDTSASDPEDWRMDMVYDPYEEGPDCERRPVTQPPAVALRRDGKLVVVYATGDPDDLESGEDGHVVVSLTEEVERDPDTDEVREVKLSVNWLKELGDAEQTTAGPLLFDEVAWFGTFTFEGGDVCNQGIGRLWGLDFVGDRDDAEDDVIGRFPSEEEDTPPDCGTELDEDAPPHYADYCELKDAVFVGLSITYNRNCQDDFDAPLQEQGEGQAGGGGAKGGRPMLSAATGGFRPSGTGRSVPKDNRQPKANKIEHTLRTPTNFAMPLSWGVVFE